MSRYVPSRKAAQELGLHPNTLRKYADEGRIQTIRVSGQRRYDVDGFLGNQSEPKVVGYCRVSSWKQKDDLERQRQYLEEKYPGIEIVSDVGSGINFKRKGLLSLLERSLSGAKLKVVVAHKDRFTRFGFELIEWIIKRNGGEIVVLHGSTFSPTEELTQDLLTIIHVFSCRLHGLRKYGQKIKEDSGLSKR